MARHEDDSSSSSPSNGDHGEKMTANPSFLQGFTSSSYHDRGEVVIGFGKFDGNGERGHGVEWWKYLTFDEI